jgi:hypothetical protein
MSKFRVPMSEANRYRENKKKFVVTRNTNNLSTNGKRQTMLTSKSPIEFCNDFRGLLHSDYEPALRNYISQEKVLSVTSFADRTSDRV